MAIDYTAPESQFNVSLDTAEYVSNLRKELMSQVSTRSWQMCHDILWALDNEIIGWYAKHVRKDEDKYSKAITELEGMEKNTKYLLRVNSSNKDGQLDNAISKWTRVVIKHCHTIWFSKEIDKQRVALQG